MSVKITVQIESVDALIRGLKELFPSAVNKNVALNMQGVGILMQYEAQRAAPKRTGYMANEINFEMLSYGGNSWDFRLIGRAPYTVYQEFGTRYIRPRLFMTRAVQTYQNMMVDAVKDGVAEAISEVFR